MYRILFHATFWVAILTLYGLILPYAAATNIAIFYLWVIDILLFLAIATPPIQKKVTWFTYVLRFDMFLIVLAIAGLGRYFLAIWYLIAFGLLAAKSMNSDKDAAKVSIVE